MSDLERKLGDLIADGRITDEDADIARTFGQFLSESGPPPALAANGKRAYPPGHPLHDPTALRAHRARWGAYLRGEADGPVSEEPR
jgi:hypothetical protein